MDFTEPAFKLWKKVGDDDQTTLNFLAQTHAGCICQNASGGRRAVPLEKHQCQKRPKRGHRRDLGITHPAGKNRDKLLAVLKDGILSRRIRQAITLRQPSSLDTNGSSDNSGSIERRTRYLPRVIPNRMQMFHDVMFSPEWIYPIQKTARRAANRMLAQSRRLNHGLASC